MPKNTNDKVESGNCFVCGRQLINDHYTLNSQVHLPVCNSCKGTQQAKDKVSILLEGLAEDLGIGCI